jgi:TonB family protein
VRAKAGQSSQTARRASSTFKNAGWRRYLSTGLIAAIVLLAFGSSIIWNQLPARHGAAAAGPTQGQPQKSLTSQAHPPVPETSADGIDMGVPQHSVQRSDNNGTALLPTNSNGSQSTPYHVRSLSDMGANLLMPSKIPSQPPAEPASPNSAVGLPVASENLTQLAAAGPTASPHLEGSEAALTSKGRASFSFHPIKIVQPQYPARARLSHIEGQVQVELSIDRSGVVRSARALSGNAILAQAAEDAARQWRYAPYTGDDSTVFPKVTRILFNFRFNSAAPTKE